MDIIELLKDCFRPIKRFLGRFSSEYTLNNYLNRKKYREKILALKDSHKGERCFIIGNGPSLTPADLTMLKDEYTFAANRIYHIFNKTSWRPTYYFCQDEVVFKDICGDINKVLETSKLGFFASYVKPFSPKELIANDKSIFFCSKYAENHKTTEFSEHIELGVYDGSTVTYAAMQVAAYMGFSEIYLIGVDHNYITTSLKDNSINGSDVRASYFEGMPDNISISRPHLDASTLSYVKAEEYAKCHGILIANATRGGKLEVFPRVSLEDVLRRK